MLRSQETRVGPRDVEHWLSYLGGASGGVLEEFKAKKKKKHVVYGERYLLNVIHLDGRDRKSVV